MELETMSAIVDADVASVTLNRPHVLNCVNEQWVRDFNVVLDDVSGRPSIHVVVIRGAGRAFCTGIDLRALANGDIGQEFFRAWEETLRRLETMDALVIAAIHSHCIGGGLQLALACDLRIARDDARLGVTAVKEGIIPGLGMWRIARHAGLARAKRLALTADVVDAATAHQWGLVDYVATAHAFEPAITELTDRLHQMAWTSTRLTKQLITRACDASFAELLETFCGFQLTATGSTEHREAMASWRQPCAHSPIEHT